MTTLTCWVRALRTRLSRAAARWLRCSASRAGARSVVTSCQRTASRPTRARPTAVSRIIRTTARQNLGKINAASLTAAHRLLESGQAIGKVVLEGF